VEGFLEQEACGGFKHPIRITLQLLVYLSTCQHQLQMSECIDIGTTLRDHVCGIAHQRRDLIGEDTGAVANEQFFSESGLSASSYQRPETRLFTHLIWTTSRRVGRHGPCALLNARGGDCMTEVLRSAREGNVAVLACPEGVRNSQAAKGFSETYLVRRS